MKKGEILYCGEYTGFAGGIERYAFRTAQCLREAGWRVDWCGTRSARGEESFRRGFDRVFSPDDLPEEMSGCRLAILHKLPDTEFLARLRARLGDRLVFLAHDHDLYCPRRHYYTPFGRINCHRAFEPIRCGLCSHLASPRNWPDGGRSRSALLRELRNHHAAVLSSFMKDNLVRNGFREERIHTLPPVIEPSASFPARTEPGKDFRILFLGQLIRGKGADLLLRALADLRIPWRATLAGDGNDRAMLENLAESLKIADRIHFTGWLDDPGSCFADCDAAVFPSRWQEPFGLSGAEALAHGVPVVAFDVGGVREWLEDGVSGFLVPELDVAAFSAKLEELYGDPALRKRMGASGAEHMRERFSRARFLEAVEHLAEAVNP